MQRDLKENLFSVFIKIGLFLSVLLLTGANNFVLAIPNDPIKTEEVISEGFYKSNLETGFPVLKKALLPSQFQELIQKSNPCNQSEAISSNLIVKRFATTFNAIKTLVFRAKYTARRLSLTISEEDETSILK